MPLDPVPSREISDSSIYREPRRPRSQMKVFGATALVLVGVVAAFVIYHRFDAAGQAARMAFHMPPTPITAVTAEVKPVAKFLSGIGTLQAVHQVTVAPEVGEDNDYILGELLGLSRADREELIAEGVVWS